MNEQNNAVAGDAAAVSEDTQTYRKNVEEHNREMAATEKSQLKYQKLAFIMSMLSAIFMGIVLVVVTNVQAPVSFVPFTLSELAWK